MNWKSNTNKINIQRYSKLERQTYQSKFIYVFFLNLLYLLKKTGAYNLLQKKIYQQVKFNFYSKILMSKTYLNRNCILTGRPRAVYRPFNIARNKLKYLFSNGLIPGYSKAIW